MQQKHKAEREFSHKTLEEAVERMLPDLTVAVNAAHKYTKAANESDEDVHFDRIMAQGHLMDAVEGMCGSSLWVLVEFAHLLGRNFTHESEEEEHQKEFHLHQH